MQNDFADKVALVTGGSHGIGEAAALAFARRGAKVVIAARHPEECRPVIQAIQAEGGKATAVQADVSREADVERMVAMAVETYGQLDYAFNNAGTLGVMAPLADLTEADFDDVIGTNLKGVWLSMKYEIRAMLPRNQGCIVNNSSISGLLATPDGSLYNASKHGVLGLTKCAAVEYARSGLRINAVCPGSFPTRMLRDFIAHGTKTDDEFEKREKEFISSNPTGRFGKVEEVAEVVMWLCSEAASFILGQTIVVDGGTTLL